MISIVTNVDSLQAQQNLNIDDQFQSKTIEQLTSGYRINSSGDDAAGLAIANGYRSSIAELNQGVLNANNGVSQLQIIDGGLSNISTILDRLKTLATESASSTFTGSRATLNQEYSQLLTEVTRQASNINLNAGGTFNNLLSVYIGGANTAGNATVSVDLSGADSAVDATSLGLSNTNVLGGGVGIAGNTQQLSTPPNATFVAGSSPADDQTFTFNVYSGGSAQTITATVAAQAAGSTLAQVLTSLNSQLNQYGISAGTDSSGLLQFSGSTAFTVTDGGSTSSSPLTNSSAGGTAENTTNYIVDGAAGYTAPTSNQVLTITTSTGTATVTLGTADTTLADALSAINAQTASQGVYAVESTGGGISFQGDDSFTVDASAAGVLAASSLDNTATAPSTGASITNPTDAIAAIDNAIQTLGLVQGRVGAGENLLQYATNLAQSQISSFSDAESQIRDADVAAAAANLTKAQVLTQTSVAALAQANSEPQAILKLLQT